MDDRLMTTAVPSADAAAEFGVARIDDSSHLSSAGTLPPPRT
jgi:hypothetical protein